MIAYFIYVNLFALLFWGIYWIFLKGYNNYQWSRCFLLFAITASIILPLIKLPIGFFELTKLTDQATVLNTITDITVSSRNIPVSSFGQNLALIGYFVVSGFLLLRLSFHTLKLAVYLRKQKSFAMMHGRQVLLNTKIGPGSFGKQIFFPGSEANSMIVHHEIAHLQYRHFRDQLFLNLILCFYFPVILFYIIRRESALVREFQADEYAAEDKKTYFNLLLHSQFESNRSFVIQSFFHHPLKRRIMMLSRNKKAVSKKLLLASTIIGMAILFICQQSPQALAQQKKSAKPIANFVDKTAEFPGGTDSLMNFLSTHIHSPKTEKGKDTVERKIVYQFVIDENGKVQDPRILKGFDKRYDSAVIKGIQSMPKWKPAQNHGMPVSSYYTGVLIFNGN